MKKLISEQVVLDEELDGVVGGTIGGDHGGGPEVVNHGTQASLHAGADQKSDNENPFAAFNRVSTGSGCV